MGWGYERESCLRSVSTAVGNHQTLFVHADRNDPQARSLEYGLRLRVSRIFHPDIFGHVPQSSRYQVQRVTRTGCDHNVLRRASNSSGKCEVACNFSAERRDAHKAPVEKKLGAILVQGAADLALPNLERKQAHARFPCQEWPSRVYGRYFKVDEIDRQGRRSRKRFSTSNEST